jgi:anthranilate synthase/aminodeoxychorismate synthase-like glutamine amidotransferase
MGEAFGGVTVRARRIMHGKTSPISHDGKGVFSSLPNPFDGMRYHSLVVEEATLPDCLEISARSDEGELMGLRHKSLAIEGVQFHPESIMTPAGITLLKNFMRPDYLSLLRAD